MGHTVYMESIDWSGGVRVCMAREDGRDFLLASAGHLGFTGERTPEGLRIPLTHENAEVLRRHFPYTAPARVLHHPCSIGTGDRLGLATPGHVRVFEEYDAFPVLAQQSMRELRLTGRTYADVLDAVSFAVFRTGYRHGFGADGDHLKTEEDIRTALSLGYTMITLDCSDHIRADGTGGGALPADIRDKYVGRRFHIGDGRTLLFTQDALTEIHRVYAGAIDFAAHIFKTFAHAGSHADFELSIDETQTVTSPEAHFFIANELLARGARYATIAPRFCGAFEKGVDYRGNPDELRTELRAHAAIAKQLGHKVSVHSGSDKFSIFPIVGEETGGVFHLKTAGTNWLEAMRLVAQFDAPFYREIRLFAIESFAEACAYYHVSTTLADVPEADGVDDAALPGLLDGDAERQLIHITYGQILARYGDRLRILWNARSEEYAQALHAHIGRHLSLLGVSKRA